MGPEIPGEGIQKPQQCPVLLSRLLLATENMPLGLPWSDINVTGSWQRLRVQKSSAALYHPAESWPGFRAALRACLVPEEIPASSRTLHMVVAGSLYTFHPAWEGNLKHMEIIPIVLQGATGKLWGGKHGSAAIFPFHSCCPCARPAHANTQVTCGHTTHTPALS